VSVHTRRRLATILQLDRRLEARIVAASANPARREWRSRASAIGWVVSAAAFLASGAGLAFATAGEVGRLTRMTTPTPAEVSEDVIVRNAKDDQGRSASFRILLFTDEFRWRLASFDVLENNQADPQFTPEMRGVLNSAAEIICIGASSEETPAGLSAADGRRLEEQRAARRAEQIAVWVRKAISKPVPVRKLNVGHHVKTDRGGDTSDQRRVVIVLVLHQDEQTNIDQALRAAMARESARAPIFDTLLTRYSLAADNKPFTWVD
jgi:hypothetical protein